MIMVSSVVVMVIELETHVIVIVVIMAGTVSTSVIVAPMDLVMIMENVTVMLDTLATNVLTTVMTKLTVVEMVPAHHVENVLVNPVTMVTTAPPCVVDKGLVMLMNVNVIAVTWESSVNLPVMIMVHVMVHTAYVILDGLVINVQS